MIEKELLIINQHGLHARPAAKLVKLASQFKSDVYFIYQGSKINAKSIMGIMMLAVEKGAKIAVQINGEDEEKLMRAIENLLNSGFEELV
ncbi:HPr family phosphocarrier protein [bacterium]|nr:HPr family phosphocarrier protein [FCB group bacterium]MBL7191060.1 HPr family phosphocarrier protein [bacterium]